MQKQAEDVEKLNKKMNFMKEQVTKNKECEEKLMRQLEEEKDKNRAIVLEKADLIKKMNHNLSVMQSIEAPSFS